MARIAGTPQAIMKYTMHSVLPGLGSVRGLWTRIFFDLKAYSNSHDGVKKVYSYKTISDKPMRKEKALEYIEKHGFVLLASDPDTELWGDPDGSFRQYARENEIVIPDTIGSATYLERKEEEL